jgi:hypothetical protein
LAGARVDWNAVCFDAVSEQETLPMGSLLSMCASVVELLARERPEASVYLEGESPNVQEPPSVLYQFEARPGQNWKRSAQDDDVVGEKACQHLLRCLRLEDRFSWPAIVRSLSLESEELPDSGPVDVFLCVSRNASHDRAWCWCRKSWEAEFPCLLDPTVFGTKRSRSCTARSVRTGTVRTFRVWPITFSPSELDRANLASKTDSQSDDDDSPWWLHEAD